MAIIKSKGYEFNAVPVKNSFNRRALKFKNNIITKLRAVGLTEDDVDIEIEPVAIKNVPAKASWYLDGSHLHYTYKMCNRYVDNLFVVLKVIEFEVDAVIEGKKTIEEFILDFNEEDDFEDERKAAREHLGVDHDTIDIEEINKKYKVLAKDLHPDMPNGDVEKFKALNHSHKILKRELE